MKFRERPPAVLLLQDGTVFHGKAVGKIGVATGEICFNTGMTGYQEIFTDPSYYGQILLMTPSHIGNYGTFAEEEESESMKIAGLVCKKFSDTYSRPVADSSIQDYFEGQQMVGISDVDTRAVVRYIRDKGAMNAIISSDETDIPKLQAMLDEVPSMEGLELASKVSTKEVYEFGDPNAELKVSVLDIGVKKNILRCLAERGCYLKVFPMTATAEEMVAWGPDGIMLSNGPGDPSPLTGVIDTVRQLIADRWPVFGICLGHQIIALASGLTTSKMHNGHRGANHPVKNLISGKGEVTTQNHGFVVDKESAEKADNIEITHLHLNDDSLAGMRLKDRPVFSVQYHPESSAGPNDARYLFDEFIDMMRSNVKQQKMEVSN